MINKYICSRQNYLYYSGGMEILRITKWCVNYQGYSGGVARTLIIPLVRILFIIIGWCKGKS
jgi:hypothetical protein